MVFVVDKPTDPTGVTLESWAQGFLVGSLMVMAGVTFVNMRSHVLLHKLIIIEVSTFDIILHTMHAQRAV